MFVFVFVLLIVFVFLLVSAFAFVFVFVSVSVLFVFRFILWVCMKHITIHLFPVFVCPHTQPCERTEPQEDDPGSSH